MKELIAYQPFDGNNGLLLQAEELLAYKDKELVEKVSLNQGENRILANGQDLDALLAFYTVPLLMPSLNFAFAGKARKMQMSIDCAFPSEHSLGGRMKSKEEGREENGYWSAEYIGNNVFLLDEQLPPNVRPWVKDEQLGYGWNIELPGFLVVEIDPVLRQRAALLVEDFLYQLKRKTLKKTPYEKTISNVFSADKPTWSQPLPVIKGDPLPASLEVV